MSRTRIIAQANAISWGERAAAQLHHDWLARVWISEAEGALLLTDDGEMVRIVPYTIGDGDFYLVLDADAPPLQRLIPRGTYAWRVGNELWIGDSLTVRLPESEPWSGWLDWQAFDTPPDVLARRLALLGDALLARAPEGSFAGLLPELLADQPIPDRPDLPRDKRLFRWRAARVLRGLMQAFQVGDMRTVEALTNRAAGLGPGAPPAGDHFLMGLIAGLRLWPAVIEASGLHVEPVLKRMIAGAAERTSLLGWMLLNDALNHMYPAPWHHLAALLREPADARPTDEQQAALMDLLQVWLKRPDALAASGLAGFLLPFLWDRRHLADEGV